ncbi:MAG: hypothetical protein JJLCMIEE_02684 [Acidimicrobiales bacterium]|nr:hypothetical protein [Acidimicrobiales bacterium]
MWVEMRRYWRVAVVAVLGAILAFGLSFAVPREYESTTMFLIRAADTSYQHTDANPQGNQFIDLTSGLTVGQTQVELATSRTVAEQVVDELDLDAPENDEEQGPIGKALGLVTGGLTRGIAYITHGHYREPDPYEKAVGEVQGSLVAEVQQNSWVLNLKCYAGEAEEAQQICDTASQVIEAESQARFRENAENQVEFLTEELTRMSNEVTAAAQALADYESENDIVTANDALNSLDAQTARSVPQQIQDLTIDLASEQARLASLQADLAGTPEFQTSNQQIVTGRSSTDVETSLNNPTYSSLQSQIDTTNANIASIEAELAQLQGLMGDLTVEDVNNQQVELLGLQADLDAANIAYQAVASQYELAVVAANGSETRFDLTLEQDQPTLPTYPARPLRYLYLFLGLFIGALAGGLLTWMHSHRPLSTDEEGDAVAPPAADEIDLTEMEPTPAAETQRIDLTRLKALSEQGAVGEPPGTGRGNGGESDLHG